MVEGEYRSIGRRVRECVPELEIILKAAHECPAGDVPPVPENRPLAPQEKCAIEKAEEVVAARAKALGIERCVLATKGQLTHLVRAVFEGKSVAGSRLAEGWRRSTVGDEAIAAVGETLGRETEASPKARAV